MLIIFIYHYFIQAIAIQKRTVSQILYVAWNKDAFQVSTVLESVVFNNCHAVGNTEIRYAMASPEGAKPYTFYAIGNNYLT